MAAAVATLSNTTYANRTNTTITAPTGITNGDWLFLFFFQGTGGSTPGVPTPPTGFTELTGSPVQPNAGGFFGDFRAYQKVASGESGDYTVVHDNASSQGVMVRVSGADTGAALVISPNSGTGSTTTFLSVTTPENDCLVLAAAMDWADTANNLTPPSGTTPTFSEHLDVTLTYVASGVLATAGATGNKTMTNNANSSNAWASYLISIESAGGSTPGAGSDSSLVGIAESSSNLIRITIIEETS